jgi:hypothetical protein
MYDEEDGHRTVTNWGELVGSFAQSWECEGAIMNCMKMV